VAEVTGDVGDSGTGASSVSLSVTLPEGATNFSFDGIHLVAINYDDNGDATIDEDAPGSGLGIGEQSYSSAGALSHTLTLQITSNNSSQEWLVVASYSYCSDGDCGGDPHICTLDNVHYDL
jgi:hypothetical protein